MEGEGARNVLRYDPNTIMENDMRASILIAVPVLCAIGLLVAHSELGQAAGGSQGQFSIAAQGASNGAWILDQRTGRVRFCVPPLQMNTPPDCTAWGDLQ